MEQRNAQVIVYRQRLKDNIAVLNRPLKENVKKMAVIKADAYGHGAVEVARTVGEQVDWFAVNSTEEGVELREEGIEHPVLVFGVPEQETAQLYKKHNLTATVSAPGHFRWLPAGTHYHLNFDTGMGRLGFHPSQCTEVRELVDKYASLTCTGLYSHFATADEPGSDKPVHQLGHMHDVVSAFSDLPDVHMSNTAAIASGRDAQFSMVRFGIGMYGYAPGRLEIPGLLPAMHWRTRLVQVKSIRKGASVSYGATWQAPGDGYIGIVPVGYADGVHRSLSGNLEVVAGGDRYPVVGTVTMNYCMISLGSDPLPVGSEVWLWNDELNASVWAGALESIPYEMLTSVTSGIPRLYR